jgi:hypothetical protein
MFPARPFVQRRVWLAHQICQAQHASVSRQRSTPAQYGTIRLPAMCLNQEMFARRIRVDYEENGQRHPCPMKWMDSFSMRNFTNASLFDDTLPVADGLMEIGAKVPLDELKTAMEDWFRKKSYLPKNATLVLAET